jgi:hypothetical protein
MLASYAFRPRTSVCSRNVAVDSAFVCPLYRGRVAFDYRVFYVVAFYAFAAFSQCCFYLLSAYLVMYIVDLYLCWWLSILYCLSGAPLVQCWFFACCCSSFCVSYSFSIAFRWRVSWLVSLGAIPL